MGLTIDSTGSALPSGSGGSSDVVVTNGPGLDAVNIQDGGNSITVDGSLSISNFPSSQDVNVTNSSLAVTGPLTDAELRASAVPISASTLPLPAGAASEITLMSIDSYLAGTLTVGGSVSVSNFPATQNVNVTNSSVSVTGPLTDTQLRATAVPVSGSLTVSGTVAATQSGTWNITNVSGTVSLPTGASTGALQTSGNASLTSIDGKLGSLGQKTMAGSAPVVIASDQSSLPIGIPLATALGTFSTVQPTAFDSSDDTFGNPVYAMGVYDLSQGRNAGIAATDMTPGSGDLLIDTSAGTDTTFVSLGGTWTGQITAIFAIDVNTPAVNFRALETGVISSSITANGVYVIENVNPNRLIFINGILSGTAFFQADADLNTKNTGVWAKQAGTWAVSVNNASGASAVNVQDGGNSLTVDGTVAATQSGTWNISNVSGTVSLPTGASTSSLQTTGNTSLGNIDISTSGINAKLGSLGQKAMASSAPVVIASDQSALSVTGPLTDTQLRATPVPVSGTVAVTGALTDTQLRATPVPVSGTVSANATLSAETTKVIGTVNVAASQTIAVTNTGTFAAQAAGTKTNNNAAPGATNVGALTAVANAAAPTQTEGNLVALRSTLSGDLAITLDSEAVVLGAGSAAIGKLAANSGVTIGAVEMAAAQTLSTVTTVSTVTNLAQMAGQAIALNTGVRSAGTQRVTIATDDIVPASQSGTWTVQPGNTANTTPWLVKTNDGTTSIKVAPASTAAAAADPALIVAISPNNGVSLGTSIGKTLVMKVGSATTTSASADQVLLTYTVTGGKTFYLEYFDVACRLTTFAATATNFGDASLESPASTKLYTQIISGTGVTPSPIGQILAEPIPIAAGTVIRIVCTPSTTTSYLWRANLGGYEK